MIALQPRRGFELGLGEEGSILGSPKQLGTIPGVMKAGHPGDLQEHRQGASPSTAEGSACRAGPRAGLSVTSGDSCQ